MKLFKNKQSAAGTKASDRVANWLALAITKIQQRWANSLDKGFNRLPSKRKKIVFIAGCIIALLYSTAIVAFTISHTASLIKRPVVAVRPLSISQPASTKPVTVPPYIQRIERFKAYLDSLSQTPDGRRIRNGILEIRPGLLDSIHQIEIIYCKK